MSELYDITIIGGGPVGLFAAFYANLRQAKVQIIDSLPQLGGQPAILYMEIFSPLPHFKLVENMIE